MAKPVAQRQREYRKRRHGGRVDCWIAVPARAALRRIAAHRGLTIRAALETLILEADRAVQDDLEPGESWFYHNPEIHDRRRANP